MIHSHEIKYVDGSRWRKDALIELKNGRFVDVENGCFFGKNVKVLINNGEIISMPGSDEGFPKIKVEWKSRFTNRYHQ